MSKKTDKIQAIIQKINGDTAFKRFLMTHNVTTGTIFSFDYCPAYSQLVKISTGNRILSMRKSDFSKIEWTECS